MNQSPVVGGSDERKQSEQMLETPASKQVMQSSPRALGPAALGKHQGCRCKHLVFKFGFRNRPIDGRRGRFESGQPAVGFALPGCWLSQKANRLVDGLRRGARIAGRMATADQKRAMSGDAVSILKESRDVNEQPLLENGRHWIVEIRRLRERPKLFDDFRSLRRGREETRH